jgi:hypothetical protein
MPQSSTNVSKFYKPLFTFAGREWDCPTSDDGGPCGKEFDAQKYGAYGK